MKKNQIRVGGHYTAKISENIVVVRVDSIREVERYVGSAGSGKRASMALYDVTNLKTGRKTIFRSAMRFRSQIVQSEGVST